MTQFSCLFVRCPLCVITADFNKTRGNNTSLYYTVTFTKWQWRVVLSSFVHESCKQTQTSLIRFGQNDASQWQICNIQIKVTYLVLTGHKRYNLRPIPHLLLPCGFLEAFNWVFIQTALALGILRLNDINCIALIGCLKPWFVNHHFFSSHLMPTFVHIQKHTLWVHMTSLYRPLKKNFSW